MQFEKYSTPCSEQGKIECIHYATRAYALEAIYGKEYISLEKTMYVYLPHQYDPEKKYNVLYLMHGGTDDEGYWFGKGRYSETDTQKYTEFGNITRNMVDHLIHEKAIEPLIIVTPSFCEDVPEYQRRPEYPSVYFNAVNYFWMELKQDIMPYVQQNYATYAQDSSDAAFAMARDHTGYAGASQGSITGLNSVMLHMLDRIGYIGSFSAGVIQHRLESGEVKVELDEAKIQEIANAVNGGPEVLYWYNGCGDHDMMYPTHRATFDALKDLCRGKLLEDRDGKGNCFFSLQAGGEHRYRYWNQDLEYTLQKFYR